MFVYTYDDKCICLANFGKYDEAVDNKVALDKLRSKEKKQRNINISSDITSDMQSEMSLMISRNYDGFERWIRS